MFKFLKDKLKSTISSIAEKISGNSKSESTLEQDSAPDSKQPPAKDVQEKSDSNETILPSKTPEESRDVSELFEPQESEDDEDSEVIQVTRKSAEPSDSKISEPDLNEEIEKLKTDLGEDSGELSSEETDFETDSSVVKQTAKIEPLKAEKLEVKSSIQKIMV